MVSLAEFAVDESVRAPSRTSTAYARLRSEILAGHYASGARLKVSELAASLAVNPGAIREALSRLVSEQLVVARDQRGFIAAPLTIEDLQDLTDLRCDIEEMALRRALERGDAEWEASILASAHRLRRTHAELGVERYGTPEWKAQHASFHASLVGACGSARLLALHAQLYQQSERYRGLALHFVADRKVDEEHQALADAALDRDSERLVDLAVAHLRKSTELIIAEARRTQWGAGAPTP